MLLKSSPGAAERTAQAPEPTRPKRARSDSLAGTDSPSDRDPRPSALKRANIEAETKDSASRDSPEKIITIDDDDQNSSSIEPSQPPSQAGTPTSSNIRTRSDSLNDDDDGNKKRLPQTKACAYCGFWMPRSQISSQHRWGATVRICMKNFLSREQHREYLEKLESGQDTKPSLPKGGASPRVDPPPPKSATISRYACPVQACDRHFPNRNKVANHIMRMHRKTAVESRALAGDAEKIKVTQQELSSGRIASMASASPAAATSKQPKAASTRSPTAGAGAGAASAQAAATATAALAGAGSGAHAPADIKLFPLTIPGDQEADMSREQRPGQAAPQSPPAPQAAQSNLNEEDALGLHFEGFVHWDDNPRTRAGLLPIAVPRGSSFGTGHSEHVFRVAITGGGLSRTWNDYLENDPEQVFPTSAQQKCEIPVVLRTRVRSGVMGPIDACAEHKPLFCFPNIRALAEGRKEADLKPIPVIRPPPPSREALHDAAWEEEASRLIRAGVNAERRRSAAVLRVSDDPFEAIGLSAAESESRSRFQALQPLLSTITAMDEYDQVSRRVAELDGKRSQGSSLSRILLKSG